MSVDPTESLTQIRELTGQISAGDFDREEAIRLAGHVGGLDDWIVAGGYLPDQWRNVRRGRPRRQGDGDVVLQGVNHGTRNAYNKGCRCGKCTQANRDAAARRYNRKKES